MGQKSSIKTLPKDLLERVNFLLAEDAITLDDLVAFLDEAGHPRSRSSLGRHKQNIDKVAAKLRESREMTEALVKELGDAAPQGKQGRLLVEMARGITFDLLMKLQDKDELVDPKAIALLGKGLAEMGRALRLDQDFELKIEDRIKTEVVASAEEALVKEGGLSEEQAKFWRHQFLGVPEKK